MNDIKEILSTLSIKEKIKLLSGANYWQTKSIKEIPSITTSDGPHGLRCQSGDTDNIGFHASNKATCFPTASSLACSFDEELLYKVGQALGSECLDQNVDILLGPGINIKRSPLCGRSFEYFSEDPHLTGKLASSYVLGVQSKNVGTSLKHFACNNQETRRLISNSVVDLRTLHDIYLKPFKMVIKDANPSTVMASYNMVNGEYVCESSYLLKDVLRKELNYDGLIITDWGALNDEVKGFKNGLNLEMPGVDKTREKRIYKRFKKGEISEKEIDDAIFYLLKLCKKQEVREKEKVDYDKHYDLARYVANECSVLLKNDDSILPLKKEEKVLFVGGFCQNIRYQGGGSSNVNPHKLEELDEVLKNTDYNYDIEPAISVVYDEILHGEIQKAKEKAKAADKVVFLCGLPLNFESEGYDRKHLNLPNNQLRLFYELFDVNRNIVLVLLGGAPFEIPFYELCKGAILKYLGGAACAASIVDTLYGKTNPSGRVSETWPMTLLDTPVPSFPEKNLNVLYKEGPYIGYRHYNYYDIKPRFPFGYGMSFASIKYSSFYHDGKNFGFMLTNESAIKAKEVVQIYVEYIENGKSYLSLKEIKKVSLDMNEAKSLKFSCDDEYFSFFDTTKMKEVVGSGNFKISIRKNASEVLYSFDIYNEGNSQFVIPKANHEFSNLLERKNNKKGSFDINSTIDDLNSSKLGRFLNKIIKKIAKIYVKKHPDLKEVLDQVLYESPLRILVLGTNGKVSYATLDKILRLLNGKKHT